MSGGEKLKEKREARGWRRDKSFIQRGGTEGWGGDKRHEGKCKEEGERDEQDEILGSANETVRDRETRADNGGVSPSLLMAQRADRELLKRKKMNERMSVKEGEEGEL